MTEIIIVGFPKSGNTWLSRLLGDALDLEITGINEAIPLAADQQERHGDGLIRQLHLVPSNDVDERRYPGFIASQWTINPKFYSTQKVIHILRDPRDIAVSVDAYWGINDLDKTLTDVVYTGAWPLWGTGWEKYITLWRASDLPHFETRYEWLHADTALEIRRLCDLMGVKMVKPLDEVIQRNEINTKRAYLRGADDNAIRLPHGKGAQITNLRAGRVGDWREAFTVEQKRQAFILYNDYLLELGYETSPLWWCESQERNEQGLINVLDALFNLTDTGAELCSTLYRLTENVTGDIVEVGAGRGRTAIALGWRSGNHVKSVDDYADNVDWANNVYGATAKHDYVSNTRKAGVKPISIYADSLAAAKAHTDPIGLWFWDVSSHDRLSLDWAAWRDKIRGRAVVRDTFDQALGSREVIAAEAMLGEFEVERDDPGLLILRRL